MFDEDAKRELAECVEEWREKHKITFTDILVDIKDRVFSIRFSQSKLFKNLKKR